MSNFSLSNPPLICVSARVEFTPVQKINTYIDDLQESLRLVGYPHFLEQKAKNWKIENQEEAGMSVQFKELPRWNFANQEKTITIRIDHESLTLFFTDYDHFASAEPHYQCILQTVEEKIPSLQPLRVQLRYIAYIPIPSGTQPTDWVIPSVLGMPNVGALKRQGSISETSFATPEGGQFITRCMTRRAKSITLPPDILPLDAKLKFPLHSETPFLLLENVHQANAETHAFTAKSCLDQLSTLRHHNVTVFKETVTPNALEQWQ